MTQTISNIGQIAINAVDLDRAVAFYRDVLQLPFLFQIPGAAFFMCGRVRLMLTIASAPEFDHPASIVYYQIDNINAFHKHLVDQGVQIEIPPRLQAKMPDHELWMCFFRDSERNMVALMSEVPFES